MLRKHDHVNVEFTVTINGMTIDEFQKEIEKLSHLLDEMKQLSLFREDEEDLTSGKIDSVHIDSMPGIDATEIKEAPYITANRADFRIGKGEGTD